MTIRCLLGTPGLAGLCLAISTLLGASVHAATLPSGFTEVLITNGLSNPTAMQFAPDGRLFVCEQGGKLRVIKNGSLLPAAFVTLNVDSNGERGLLGVAFDPAFATNHFVYVYYTATTPTVHNRISRFTANGDVAVAGSEVAIFDLDNLSGATNHNGGALNFGPDGKLYAAVGENGNSSNAQSFNTVLGKLLRINSDGTIPADNPFLGMTTGKNRAIWALGLRNPFTFAFNPSSSNQMFINDVGETTWEEINNGVAGSNYGWPTTEGATTDTRFRSPLYAYNHTSGVCAITGGAFYSPLAFQFPSDYSNDYFFADYCGGWIRKRDSAAGNAVTTFATGISSPVDLKVSDDGSLYYLARGSNAVYRIQFGATGPTITQHPMSQTVAPGSSVTFSVRASGPPPLRYQWQRNGANISGATAQDYTISSVSSADNLARFRANVSNDFDTNGVLSNEATLTVSSNRAPTATITQPLAGTLYSGGTVINYAGTATDPDQTLPASAFTWQVDFHHDTHIHPFMPATTGATSGSFTIPTTGETSANVWYRIYLTVRDSGGLTHTTQRDVVPRKVALTLATNPSGLQLELDGQPLTTPLTLDAVVGMMRTIGATTPQTSGGTSYTFASWSDGGAASHNITTPATNTTYTATFQAGGSSGSPIALVQHVNKDAGTTASTTLAFPSANAAGNWIAVAVRAAGTNQVFTITDTRGNLYRKAVQFNVTLDGVTLAIFYAENIGGGANTIQVATSQSGTLRFAILEYSGVATANSLDVTAAAQGTGTALSSGNATTTASGDLVIGAFITANPASVTAGAGFTLRDNVPANPNAKLAVEDRVLATAGSTAAAATVGASDSWGAVLATFKPGSASPPLPPGTPGAPSPSNGATGVSTTPSLSWTATGATSYDVMFGTSNPPPTVTTNQTTATYTPPALANNTTYFWRIVARNGAGSTTGSVWSFTTIAAATPPGTPGSPGPSNGASGVSTSPSLTWTAAGATTYDVRFGTSNPPPIAASNLTSATYTPPALANSTTYFWQIVARNGAGTTTGAVWNFTTGAATSSGPIALVQHVNKDAGTTASTTLAFPSANAAGNWIAVAVRAAGTNQVFTITDTRGNLYRKAVQFNVTLDGVTLAIFYAENIGSGANTIQVATSQSGTLRFAILEYSGVATANSLDVTAAAQGTGTAMSSGNTTTTANGDLLIGAFMTANVANVTAGAGFTLRDTVPANPGSKLAVEDRVQTAAGSTAGAATVGASDAWGAVLAAFKAKP